jgi:hypothetical protein
VLYDIKLRSYDRISKRETIEIVSVDAAGGDAAAEAGAALRPGAQVVGVTPHGGFGPVGGAALEADDNPPSVDDEDSEPGPSNRELATMGVKRGPGRPRKERPS